MENGILNVRSQKKLQKQRIAYLKNEKAELASQISDVEHRYNTLIESRRKAGSQVDDAGGAVALMLYSSEVQHTQEYLSQMRQRLFFNIPEQISQLMALLEQLDTDINKLKDNVKLEQQSLAKLKPNFEDDKEKNKRDIASLEKTGENITVRIEELTQQINNMSQTRIVFSPHASEDPVSPNVRLITLLGCVTGLFMSVFAAFFLEYWTKNKEKIVG